MIRGRTRSVAQMLMLGMQNRSRQGASIRMLKKKRGVISDPIILILDESPMDQEEPQFNRGPIVRINPAPYPS